MSTTYLIPQFIIEYLQKSKSTKNPQNLIGMYLKKNRTPEIKKWFEENEVNASYIWRFFVSLGKDKFHYKTCAVCGKRIKLETILCKPYAKYCSHKCQTNSEEFKEKRKQTCKEKYGVEHPMLSKTVQRKKKQTCKEKYGVEHPFHNKEVQEKYKQTRRSNHWETFCSLLKEKDIIPLFSKEEYIKDTGRRFRCLICGEEFVSEGTCNYDKEHLNDDGTYKTLQAINIHCPNCSRKFSKKEKEVLEFVKTIYNGEVLENDRIQLEGKELDIFLRALNLGIEFDGDYWHSLENVEKRDETKNQLCEEKGIKLLRIKESDWDNNRTQVEGRIKEFLNLV